MHALARVVRFASIRKKGGGLDLKHAADRSWQR